MRTHAEKTHAPMGHSGRRVAPVIAAATLLVCVAASATVGVGVRPAIAETYTTTTTQADEGFSTVIEKARDRQEAAIEGYRKAKAEYAGDGARAYALELHADMLEDLLPVQQARSDEAARQLYKFEQDRYHLVELLLSSGSLEEFVSNAEYLDRATKANLGEINRTNQLVRDVSGLRSEVEASRLAAEEKMNAAQAEVEDAKAALESVYAAREERAKAGIAKAQQQARAGIQPDGDDDDSASAKPGISPEVDALDDGADWHMTEDEFVAEWAPRLDDYLAGSALAGQGRNFARSAWKYCIDPRWSAAISNIESGKGAICIRPHNAWGWGAADSDPYNLASEWNSWETAIDAHARGLANGYGYTITISGARTYCPPNWLTWYNTTLNEMSKI